MIDMDVAIDKLCSLETPFEIAEFLVEQGAKGDTKNAASCVVAVWLRTITGVKDIAVTGGAVHFHQTSGGFHTRTFPLQLTMFIGQFDSGLYPSLER